MSPIDWSGWLLLLLVPADYRKLMLSYSVTQMMDEPKRVGLLNDMESFIRNEFGGIITKPLVVTLTTASLVPR